MAKFRHLGTHPSIIHYTLSGITRKEVSDFNKRATGRYIWLALLHNGKFRILIFSLKKEVKLEYKYVISSLVSINSTFIAYNPSKLLRFLNYSIISKV